MFHGNVFPETYVSWQCVSVKDKLCDNIKVGRPKNSCEKSKQRNCNCSFCALQKGAIQDKERAHCGQTED